MGVTGSKDAKKSRHDLYERNITSTAYKFFNPTEDCGEIFHLAEILLEISGFVYTFYHIRNTVKAHHSAYHPDEKPSTIRSRRTIRSRKLVEFSRPALIIQDDSKTEGRQDRNLKSVITPQAIIDFFERENGANQKYLTTKHGKVVFDEGQSTERKEFKFLGRFRKFEGENVKILDYDDGISTDHGGLTYGLVVNLTQKWVCVVFRGTVGIKDGWADMNFAFDTKSLFDSEGEKEKGEKPGTHAGFTRYLVRPRRGDTKYTRYIDRIVSSLNFAFNQNEKNKDEDVNVKPKITSDFKLYVTGHSLGGGLANLFAYHLANLKARDDETAKHIPKRITAITFASPVVGNKAFQEKYHDLEEKGNLRHYRIANKHDVVPGLLPDFFRFRFFSRDCMEFVQNGLKIELDHKGKVYVSDETKANSFISQVRPSLVKNHTVKEFSTRMKKFQDKLCI